MGDPKTDETPEDTQPDTQGSGAGYGNHAQDDPGPSDRSPDER